MVDKTSNEQRQSSPDAGKSESNAAQAAENVRDSAGRVARTATEQLTATADKQKEALADRAEDVVQVVRNTAEGLSEHESWLGGYADAAADQMETAIKAIRERDAKTLMADLEQFGRRHPGLFMGASIAIGFGLARFAKSSQSRSDEPATEGSPNEPGYPSGSSAAGTMTYVNRGDAGEPRTGSDLSSDAGRNMP